MNSDDGLLNTTLLGGVLAVTAINESLAARVTAGELLLLLETTGWVGGDADADVHAYTGLAPLEQPSPECGVGDDLYGLCHWFVSESSFDASCAPRATAVGDIVDGVLETGPNDIEIPFEISGLPVTLEIDDARLTGLIAGSGALSEGRLCGTVAKEPLFDALLAACEVDDPPDICELVSEATLPLAISCDPCTVVVALEGVPVKSLSYVAPVAEGAE